MKKRHEAFLVTDLDPLFSIIMNIMPHRYDAQNITSLDIDCEQMDKYIAFQRENGKKYNYMSIIIASIVRIMAMRPKLNRFTMNARMYERYKIVVSFTIKQYLTDDSDELQVKLTFNGNETLEQISQVIDKNIENILSEAQENSTIKTASSIASLPLWLSKLAVGFLRFSDKHNFMPKMFYDVSPFHCSFFITNLKSIKTESINHHCYDFGTTSIFFAMGKEKYMPIVDDDKNIVPRKMMRVGISVDERICDGLYFGKSFHLMKRILANPSMLEEEYHDAKVDAEIEKDRLLALKMEKKLEKKQKKLEKGK